MIIGNSEYERGLPEVTYAGNDADAFRAYVIDVLGYDPENIIDLRNASQTRLAETFGNNETHRGLLWRLVDPGISDVVVFYSAHGVPGEDRRAYLLPVDANPDVPEINGYALDLLYRNLAKLEARSVAVYLDACFSGQSFGGTLSRTSGLGISPTLPAAAGGFGVLTAAAADQVAVWDDEAKHGVFTKHLLDALYGAADASDFGDGDNTITLAEVKAYLDANMTRAARRIGRIQNVSVDGNNNLVLAAFGPDGPPFSRDNPAGVQPAGGRELDEVLDLEMVTLREVRIHEGRSIQAEEIAVLPFGSSVAVTGLIEDWYLVTHKNGVGYIRSSFLGDAAAAATVEAEELADWNEIKNSYDRGDYVSFLISHPGGKFYANAQAALTADNLRETTKVMQREGVTLAEARDIIFWNRSKDGKSRYSLPV